MTTKRGINLGCGKITLPGPKPTEHRLIPEFLYPATSEIEWDNVDWNDGEGVDKVIDLFDYPWRTIKEQVDSGSKYIRMRNWNMLPDNTYDYAVASHICEHIPHHIVEWGQLVPRHDKYQDGWFAWFAELNRILKPGGRAFVLVPYAWSTSGISDPTHTRYLTPASFNYLIQHDESPFVYRNDSHWKPIDYTQDFSWTPHLAATARIQATMRTLTALNVMISHGLVVPLMGDWNHEDVPEDENSTQLYHSMTWQLGNSNINMIVDFMIELTKVTDATERQE